MSDFTAAIIGTGPDPEDPDLDGFAMGYRHADGYEAADCEVVACADLVRENAEAFAENYGLPGEAVFEDYRAMLDAVEPDVVSVTVPPVAHEDVVLGCVRSGVVDAVHCEKPMALTWGGARRMAQAAWRRDVQLTFNHQRRFGGPFRQAKELLDDGVVGDLERLELAPSNLYDYGSHSIDLCSMYVDETAAEWVIGNVDYREESIAFGAHQENQAVVQWEYADGVTALAAAGEGSDLVDCHNRLVCENGTIEVGPGDADAHLRYRTAGDSAWTTVDCGDDHLHGPDYVHRAIAEVVDALETGRESELSARNALNATEIIFGAWESARRRGRVDFPLEIDDNPLEAMVESGALDPEPPADADDA